MNPRNHPYCFGPYGVANFPQNATGESMTAVAERAVAAVGISPTPRHGTWSLVCRFRAHSHGVPPHRNDDYESEDHLIVAVTASGEGTVHRRPGRRGRGTSLSERAVL